MANVTISLEEELLRKARMRALQQGTSLNAQIRQFLEQYAGMQGGREDVVQRVLTLSKRSQARRGGERWTRDELYQR